MATAIFFASSTGNSEEIANKIVDTLLEKRLFAYGISFPTSNVKIEPVEFAVNTIYAINNYEGFEDDEE